MTRLHSLGFLLLLATIQPGFSQDILDTYQLALESEPDYKSAYLNQYATAEIKSQSIARMLPNLSLTANSSRDRLHNKKQTFQRAGTQYFWNNTFTVNLVQPVFHWEHWVQLSQADNKIAQAEAQFQSQSQALIVKTVSAYFNILAAQDNLDFTIAEKKAIEKQLEQAKQRFEVGMIAITDVHESQAAYDQARADEIEAENLLDDEKENLREIIGDSHIELAPLLEQIDLNLPEPADISSWANSATTNNFSLIAQLNQTEVARKEITLQQSGHLPTLDIVANYGMQDNTSTFGLRGDTQSVGVQLNVPLFEGGAVSSRSKQARYEYQKQQQNLIKVKRTILRQVKNAYRGVTSSYSRVQALKATVKSAEVALQTTEAGFEVGTRTMVDVLAEQRNLYRAKRDYARSRYDFLINSIKLKEAAGSLNSADVYQVNQYVSSNVKPAQEQGKESIHTPSEHPGCAAECDDTNDG